MIGHADDPQLARSHVALAATPVRGPLIVGACLLASIIAVATAAIIWFDRERDLVSAERELSRLSLTLAETTLRTMQSLDLILIGLEGEIATAGIATSAALRERFSSLDFHNRLVERAQNVSQLDAIVLLDDEGHVVNSTRRPPITAAFDFSDRDYYIAHRSTPGLSIYIGQPVRNRVTGAWTMFVARRIEARDGTFVGVLNAVVRTQFFEDLFKAVAPGEAATISLFRNDGILLARYPMSEDLVGRSFGAQPMFTDIMPNAATAAIRTPASALDGMARVMTPTAVNGYPLIVNVTNSDRAILAAWRQKSVMTAVIAAAAAGLIVLLGILFGRQLDLRMRMAQSQAEREEADRSESKTRELADSLQKNLRQLRAVTDHLPVLIAYIDRNLKFRFINKTGEAWYARPETEIVGSTLHEVLRRPPTLNSEELFERLSKGPVRDIRTRQQPDGTTRTLDVLQVPDIGPDGKVAGYYALLTDITERMTTEEQLRQSQKLDAIGKLTGGIAHDFNNLLAVILGNLEMAHEGLAAGKNPSDCIEIALRATEQGAELTRSLLSFARQQPLSPQPIRLNALIAEAAILIRRTLPENIYIDIVGGTNLWPCHADPSQVKNAVLNLAINSRDAMPSGGRLTIETANVTLDAEAGKKSDAAPGDYVMLAVSDTGIGMSPEVAAQAFEPFFTTKDMGHGTGLGLSMVYGFAKQSNGNVKIYSEIGHGTVVKLYLPRSRDTAAQPIGQIATVESAERSERILVVEDNADVRSLAVAMLTTLGYRVFDAEAPRQALEILERTPEIDLLLSDVVLSDTMNGPQLAAAAVRLKPDLKVLLMSGYTENALKHKDTFQRNIRLLQKPFRKQDLAQAIRETLAREN